MHVNTMESGLTFYFTLERHKYCISWDNQRAKEGNETNNITTVSTCQSGSTETKQDKTRSSMTSYKICLLFPLPAQAGKGACSAKWWVLAHGRQLPLKSPCHTFLNFYLHFYEWMKWTLIYRLLSGWSIRSLCGPQPIKDLNLMSCLPG